MVRIKIARTVVIPNPLHLERCRKVPELGPKILFFSGGTALRNVSRVLVEYTHNSIHLITPFDSGGSSAKLRKAFRMLAVGDLRNRLMALADRSVRGQKKIFNLFAFRFPKDVDEKKLRRWLKSMVKGRDAMIQTIEEPMRRLIRNHLGYFTDSIPDNFSLRGANIGNLILAGGYLNNGRHIDPVVFLFSKLVEVRGVVRPISSEFLHLAATLENGKTVVGQHRLTGREVPPIKSPIKEIYLTKRIRDPKKTVLPLRNKVRKLIESAELICYPVGSFYTSVLANLLVKGVGDAVAELDVPKVYLPNTAVDVEELGLSISQKVEKLLHYLHSSCERKRETRELLSHVIVDAANSGISLSEVRAVEAMGVEVIDLPLICPQSDPYLDAKMMAETLLSLAG